MKRRDGIGTADGRGETATAFRVTSRCTPTRGAGALLLRIDDDSRWVDAGDAAIRSAALKPEEHHRGGEAGIDALATALDDDGQPGRGCAGERRRVENESAKQVVRKAERVDSCRRRSCCRLTQRGGRGRMTRPAAIA